MNKYLCEKCNYETNDKSNYNKHLQSVKHNKKKVNRQQNTLTHIKTYKNEGLVCSCGKQFSYASGLSRHKKICNGVNINEVVEKLNTEINELKQKMKEQEELNIRLAHKTEQTSTNVFNISVKNYIQQNYSSAPSLAQLEDYSVIEDECDDFGEKLISVYNKGSLHKYLGDIIIKYYKKDDPKEQSLWNSDTSRLTYIIKELINASKSSWYKDPKGVKTKSYIIDPLLNYIMEYCIKYNDEHEVNLENWNDLSANDCITISQNQIVMGNIITNIKNDTLANDIIRYIAPYFVIQDVKLLK